MAEWNQATEEAEAVMKMERGARLRWVAEKEATAAVAAAAAAAARKKMNNKRRLEGGCCGV